MSNKFTEEELAMLSDTEREAILGDDEVVDVAEVAEAIEEDEVDDTEAEDGEEIAEDEAEVTAEAEVVVDDKEDVSEEVEVKEEVAQRPQREFAPKLQSNGAGIAENLVSIASQVNALNESYDLGDVEPAEYRKQFAALQSQREDLLISKAKAEFAEDFNKQTAKQLWSREQDNFFSLPENKVFETNKYLYTALDAAVEDVSNDQSFTITTGLSLLTEAARRLRESGILPKQESPKVEKKVEPKAEKVVPITLRGIPSAASSDPRKEGEFADIEKLSGLDYEESLARMTPEQERRFLRSK